MWSSRLREAVRRAGGQAVPLSTSTELEVVLEAHELDGVRTLCGVLVDLSARHFDGIEAIERVTAARLPVLALAQHDDQSTRRRALDAGALRVFSYRKFFEDGTALVGRWLKTGASVTGESDGPMSGGTSSAPVTGS
jgi:DNA-binding NarL/FixJ family response regulator